MGMWPCSMSQRFMHISHQNSRNPFTLASFYAPWGLCNVLFKVLPNSNTLDDLVSQLTNMSSHDHDSKRAREF